MTKAGSSVPSILLFVVSFKTYKIAISDFLCCVDSATNKESLIKCSSIPFTILHMRFKNRNKISSQGLPPNHHITVEVLVMEGWERW